MALCARVVQLVAVQRRTILLIAAAGIALACSREPRAPVDTLLASYSAAERARPSSPRALGGLDMWAYCKSIGYPTVGYKLRRIQGPRAALDNWSCQRGTDQLEPVEPVLIDMVAACRSQYKRQDVAAWPTDTNHAWSWHCYPAAR
jgi:hypothetical protein